MSSVLSEKDNEGSSNTTTTHSEKIVKKKGEMIENSEISRSSIGGKTTTGTSLTTSTKMLPPKCKGVQRGDPGARVSKKVEDTELFLD